MYNILIPESSSDHLAEGGRVEGSSVRRVNATLMSDELIAGTSAVLQIQLVLPDEDDWLEGRSVLFELLPTQQIDVRCWVIESDPLSGKPAEFIVTATQAGSHKLRLRVWSADYGYLLQELETTLEATSR